MQWETWAEIPQETKILVRDKLSVNFEFKDISLEIARLEGCPTELEDRPEDWEWLCNHFTDPKFVKKFVAGKIARESKTLFHHSGSKPFSRILSSQRSTCSRTFTFDLTMTKVLDQKYGRRHGKVVRGMGKAQTHETGASSSKSTTGEVNALKEEVTTLKGQLAAQDEQIKAHSEQMRAQSEHIKAENEQMRAENKQIKAHGEQMKAQMSMIVQALAVSSLQI
ncbi:hypothetical protein D8674_039168 [Pyrus ussuriensis x Pyrus communis]|uniref:Uncharacterized protein n=1 Tax=Pyrus ussuriensis x Pyrus communis TaxID=2448454 RepID=A0A5N5I806_9ROSA|nr:hypothetical protein D8674_039168 [Pyrus ussuriensis x Pyrus communis]